MNDCCDEDGGVAALSSNAELTARKNFYVLLPQTKQFLCLQEKLYEVRTSFLSLVANEDFDLDNDMTVMEELALDVNLLVTLPGLQSNGILNLLPLKLSCLSVSNDFRLDGILLLSHFQIILLS